MLPNKPVGTQSISPKEEAYERRELDCKQGQAAKIERFLGSRDAGMLDAIRWANSDDPRERMLATYVLSDIGTAEALRYERTLSHDADIKAAELARRKVGHWGKQNSYEGPDFERATPEHPRNF